MGLGLLILLKKLTTKESLCLAQEHPQPFCSGQADLDINCPGHMLFLQPMAARQNSKQTFEMPPLCRLLFFKQLHCRWLFPIYTSCTLFLPAHKYLSED